MCMLKAKFICLKFQTAIARNSEGCVRRLKAILEALCCSGGENQILNNFKGFLEKCISNQNKHKSVEINC